MKNLAVRVSLVLLAVAGCAGAGYLLFTTDRQIEGLRHAGAAVDRDITRVRALVTELRAAQPAYLVASQDRRFWTGKVGGLVKDAQAATQAIPQAHSLTSESGQELATSTEALSSFARFDTRIRELLDDGQPLTAATLVFSDASQLLTAADRAASRARQLQLDAVGRQVDALRWRQAYTLGGAAGLALVAILLLAPRSGRPVAAADEASASPAGEGSGLSLRGPASIDDLAADSEGRRPGAAAMALSGDPDLGDGVVTRARPVVADPAPAASSAAPPSAAGSSARLSERSAGLLSQTASLCGDLSRVSNSDELQRVLIRSAALLDAAGIVLWVAASGEGGVLQPALSCGYSDLVMAKMRALPRDSENAVSSAVRQCRTEIVAAGPNGSGAIVVPLLTPGGCTGAMAVETRNRGESSEVVRSLATIIAAQIAAFLPQTEA